jgi:hypothetical protein
VAGRHHAAAARSYRIISCRPSEAETRSAFGGLADLLSDAAPQVLPKLPPIRQRALEAALLIGESDMHADERALAAACLGAVRPLARERPLCVAVDDLQCAALGRADPRRAGAHRRPWPLGHELTESERRIAGLVAEGKTNREIAAPCF